MVIDSTDTSVSLSKLDHNSITLAVFLHILLVVLRTMKYE